ncbi:MAG: hypothetical protein ACK6CP_06565 [Pseudanabaena sp.]|jgi:hypothetical protein|uniref:hypothetical protein n=1 Tax=Microcystis sp. M058S1 TaxID=2771123 RepID=UPI00258B0E37|nr:hypothetical protein [Microcystis sp. M058S1]MCA6502436.1 hypothetical protein [Pseudanabaena sp. M090S1SP2A07QC]MCA6517255.1 hypothetical protein [Pseudanabaena sp. M110S1SP2A07QC]MCA6531517.1 hypothetical protein [Pseudanabaena sp. M125S2SP2A07QC]MCA6535275.1 hypothetical protein [Pseudanabaena sp. M176S2SP2A07QC]MCA6540408.1 hypothetical protein [Pseudanabaena sp. M037S2SP2A07QC]MCA6543236.1 hypothetical protein [Pseudanabaena sp. M074S1SP2A07QC]MCA6548305.1 hypothetical protein [Pseud
MSIDLFPKKPAVSAEQSQQVKDWLYEILQIDRQTVISLSQLQCQDSGCPPIQTAIAVMTSPHRVIRIHKAIPDIAYTDVVQAIAANTNNQKES